MRKKILESVFDDITIIKPDIDEKKIRSFDPYKLPKMITKQKTLEVTRKLIDEDLHNNVHILITSDQIAIFNNEIREKPIDKDQAFNFLKSYSNNEVTTVSSIFVTNLNTGKQMDKTIVDKVKWKEISEEKINSY